MCCDSSVWAVALCDRLGGSCFCLLARAARASHRWVAVRGCNRCSDCPHVQKYPQHAAHMGLDAVPQVPRCGVCLLLRFGVCCSGPNVQRHLVHLFIERLL
jgi:hypothetical protein